MDVAERVDEYTNEGVWVNGRMRWNKRVFLNGIERKRPRCMQGGVMEAWVVICGATLTLFHLDLRFSSVI